VVEILPVRETLPVTSPNDQLIPKQKCREHPRYSCYGKKFEQADETYRQSRTCKSLINHWTDFGIPAVQWFSWMSPHSFGAFLSLRSPRTDELPGAFPSADGLRSHLPCSVFLQWASHRTSHCTGTRYKVSYPENFTVGTASLRKNSKQSAGSFT